MSATTAPTDFSDLYTDLLQRVRQGSSTTATLNQAKRYINIGLRDMHVGFGEKFPWAERRATFNTHPGYSTGTVTINQQNQTMSIPGAAWTTANGWTGTSNVNVGGRIRIAGGHEVYRILTVNSATSGTIDTVFISESVTGASYQYFEDEIPLASDFLKPVDNRRFTNGHLVLDLIGRSDFRRRFGANHILGRPRHATLIDLDFDSDTAPRRRLLIHPPPDGPYLFEYDYVTSFLAVTSAGVDQTALSSDADEPIVPLRYRQSIVLHALYNWYRDKKDDQRSAEAKAEYTDLMLRITGDTEIGQQRFRLNPRQSPYVRRSRSPWRGRGRRYDLNGAFDRLEDIW